MITPKTEYYNGNSLNSVDIAQQRAMDLYNMYYQQHTIDHLKRMDYMNTYVFGVTEIKKEPAPKTKLEQLYDKMLTIIRKYTK